MEAGLLDTQIADYGVLFDQVRVLVLRTEVGQCDIDQLGELKRWVAKFGNVFDALKADIARRAGELRRGGNSHAVDNAVNPDGRQSPAQEQTESDRAEVFDQLPGLDDATRSGELSGRYADVVAKATAGLSAEVRAEFYRRHQDLAARARSLSEADFKRYVQQLVERVLGACGVERTQRQRNKRTAKKWTDLTDKMWNLRGMWDPDTGARMNTALEAEVKAIYRARRDHPTDLRLREQIIADAITNLICGTPLSRQNSNGGGTTLVVITDQTTVTGDPHDESVHEYSDGTPTATSTVTRLADHPDTETIAVIVNEHGVVVSMGDAHLNEGRGKRFATRPQRLALRAMHRTCIIPGCDMAFDACEIHHLTEYDAGGHTDLANLAPLCAYHHHRLHAEHWKLRLDPTTRHLTITYPDGTTKLHPFTGLTSPSGPTDKPNPPPTGDAA